MAYIDSKNTAARAPAIIAVAAIHAVLGVAIVTGLAGSVMEQIAEKKLITYDLEKKLPPPPPEVEPARQDEPSIAPPVFTPAPPFQLDPKPPLLDTTDLIPQPTPVPIPNIGPAPTPGLGAAPTPAPTLRFEPAAPKPRNDPGAWVTNNDYRSSWINREWAGTAGFRLKVGANGRVEQCTIVNSTGHDALDAATCALVERRARFDPAKNDRGEKVTGTFSSAVRWQIPE